MTPQRWYHVNDEALVDLNEVALVELMLGHEGWPVRLTLRSGRYVEQHGQTYEGALSLKHDIEAQLGTGPGYRCTNS